jgi:two-component system, LytTR family, response regulator
MADMTQIHDGGSPDRAGHIPLARQLALGFLYWLFFLLMLEPDNVVRALRAGGGLFWSQEIIRIAGASLLGASVTPLLFALVRRFPLEGKNGWRNGAIQAAGAIALGAALIALSCVLAALVLASEHRPLLRALGEEFVANWPLVVFGLAGLIAIVHALRFFALVRTRERIAVAPDPGAAYLTRVPVKARGTQSFVELNDVAWIEAQGNYLALHASGATHLIRESLTSFETKLDPKRFARIHRRTIVAIARVREIEALGAGDALLRLDDGTELRLSRSFRESLVSLRERAAS